MLFAFSGGKPEIAMRLFFTDLGKLYLIIFLINITVSSSSFSKTKENKKKLDKGSVETSLASMYFKPPMTDEEWKTIAGNKINEVYITQKGDDLWDISKKYFGDPFYWPKIWALNPQITNPHYIEKNTEIVFNPSKTKDLLLNTQKDLKELSKFKEEFSFDKENKIKKKTSTDDLLWDKFDFNVDFSANKKIENTIQLPGFISTEQIPIMGEISGSLKESAFLSTGDIIYINPIGNIPLFKNVKYNIIQYEGDIADPSKFIGSVGEFVRILGVVKILNINSERAEAIVEESFEPIVRGNYLTDYESKIHNLKPRYNGNRITARVVLGDTKNHTIVAQGQTVYIDKGSNDGIENGNILYALRNEDGLEGKSGLINNIPIASLIVMNAHPNTAVCKITKSVSEINIGDFVEILP